MTTINLKFLQNDDNTYKNEFCIEFKFEEKICFTFVYLRLNHLLTKNALTKVSRF